MSVAVVFQQMVVMFLLMGLGFLLARLKVFSTTASADFSKMVTVACNPALIVVSALNREASVSRSELLYAVLIMGIYFAFLIGSNMLIPLLVTKKKGNRKFYQVLGNYGNIGFMGIPLISVILGNEAIFYLSILIIIFNLFMYSHGVGILLKGEKDIETKFEWRQLINPGMISSLGALIIYLADLSMPVIATQSIQYVGQSTTCIAMVVIGMALSRIPAKALFTEYPMYLFIAIRYLIMPVVAAFCLKPIMQNQLLLSVIIITMALPAGNMSLMFAEKYGINPDLLAKGLVMTSIFSVVTVTVASWVLVL